MQPEDDPMSQKKPDEMKTLPDASAEKLPDPPAAPTAPSAPKEETKADAPVAARAGSSDAKSVSDYGSGPQHHAARVLHCWDDCFRHTGKEMALTPEDYRAAVAAASKRKTVVEMIDGKKNVRKFYDPHVPALFDPSKIVAPTAAEREAAKATREAEKTKKSDAKKGSK
jgi:hypothetical protein